MARLTITEAIKRAPIGKSQFYAKYVDRGLLSISVDSSGKKYVESSELLRCFGEMKSLQSDSSPLDVKSNKGGPSNSDQLDMIKLLKEQLEKAENREEKHLAHIASLTLRLEPPVEKKPVKRSNIVSRWWYGLDKDEA